MTKKEKIEWLRQKRKEAEFVLRNYKHHGNTDLSGYNNVLKEIVLINDIIRDIE